MQARRTTYHTADVTDARTSQLMRRVNEAFRRFTDVDDPAAPLAFFCECTAGDCYSAVWLTAAEYERRAAADGWIVAAGHS
jgi:hypothetical protein